MRSKPVSWQESDSWGSLGLKVDRFLSGVRVYRCQEHHRQQQVSHRLIGGGAIAHTNLGGGMPPGPLGVGVPGIAGLHMLGALGGQLSQIPGTAAAAGIS